MPRFYPLDGPESGGLLIMELVKLLLISILVVVFLSACSTSKESDMMELSKGSEVIEKDAEQSQKPTEDEVDPVKKTEGISAKSGLKADKDSTLKIGVPNPALLDPRQVSEEAPAHFKVQFNTTNGEFVVDVHREWCPRGADRFYNLVNIGFFTDVAFFRVLEGFVAQFGISGDPQISEIWDSARIPDDPVKQSNLRGSITFATAGPNTRTTQFFINFNDNSSLDGMGFSPFGKVTEGMEVVDSLYADYGEGAPRGSGPSQGQIKSLGNSYLKEGFPNLDYIKRATIIS